MSDTPLKQQLLEMSLDGVRRVLEIIESRPDVVSVVLLDEIDLLEMKAEDENHFRGLVTQIRRDIDDEPA